MALKVRLYIQFFQNIWLKYFSKWNYLHHCQFWLLHFQTVIISGKNMDGNDALRRWIVPRDMPAFWVVLIRFVEKYRKTPIWSWLLYHEKKFANYFWFEEKKKTFKFMIFIIKPSYWNFKSLLLEFSMCHLIFISSHFLSTKFLRK